MIVDSSALIAILLREPEAETFARTLLASPRNRISAVNFVEAAIIADARMQPTSRADAFDDLVQAVGLEVEGVTREHATDARIAYRRFGKGYHPARLNFGDCFAYALASEAGEPLLFKGDDFSRTDIISAL